MKATGKNPPASDWVRTTVGEVFTVVGGGTPSTRVPEYWNGDVPWITSADIDGGMDICARKFISEQALKHSAASVVPAGSIIVVTRVGLGKVGIVDRPMAFSQDCQGLIPRSPNFIEHKFAAYQLSLAVRVFKHISRGTTISGVTKRQVLGLPFLLPSLDEQRRIVAAIDEQLSRIDAAFSMLRNSLQNLHRLHESILQAAVNGRLVPQDPNDEPAEVLLFRHGIISLSNSSLPQLPRRWAWAPFSSLVRVLRNGIFVGRPKRMPPGIPILRISAVRSLHVDLADIRYLSSEKVTRDLAEFFIEEDNLLFTRYNGNPELVGACGRVRGLQRPTLHPDKLIRAVVKEGVALPQFLELVVSTGISREHIRGRRRTTAGQTGISGADLKAMPVPIPPLGEQARIAEAVETYRTGIEVIAKAVRYGLRHGEALRRAILSNAFGPSLIPLNSDRESETYTMKRDSRSSSKSRKYTIESSGHPRE